MAGLMIEIIRNAKKEPEEDLVKMPMSQPVGYYLKHEINKKLIEGLIGNQRFNDSLLAMQLGIMDNEIYDSLPVGPIHKAILKKKITKKEDDLIQSHIYPLGIAEDVLVEITGFIYPVDLVILDIKEDKKSPFILGTPFLMTAKAEIRFDKGIITLKSGKNKNERKESNSTKRRIRSLTNGEVRCLTMDVHSEMKVVKWVMKEESRKECDSESSYKTLSGDGVRIFPDGVTSPDLKPRFHLAQSSYLYRFRSVIFDKKKLWTS
ncbi:retrovirus-related pol polyprotein from transposon TNT 1-94 [Tanacetum coccineum]